MNLPLELIEKIYNGLSIVDTINFLSVNKKYIGVLNSVYFWKNKLKQDYKYTNKQNTKLKEKYIRFYNTLCIGCLNKTTIIHSFYNNLVCRKCEIVIPKYKIICQSNVISNYYLTKNDLTTLNCKLRRNVLNSTRPIKMYLLTDITKTVEHKYPNNNLEIYKKNKFQEKYNKCIMYCFKYSILCSFMQTTYNIDITKYNYIINIYSDNLFKKYIRNKQNNSYFSILVNCYKELDFLKSYMYIGYNDKHNNFNEHIEQIIILSDQPINFYIEKYSNNGYIIDKIAEIIKSNKYQRRLEINRYLELENIKYKFNSYIEMYIYEQNVTLTQIKSKILEDNNSNLLYKLLH